MLAKNLKLSRRKLAIQAGISPSTFQSAMQKDTSFTIDMLEKIANALQIPVENLFSKEMKTLNFNSLNNPEEGVDVLLEFPNGIHAVGCVLGGQWSIRNGITQDSYQDAESTPIAWSELPKGTAKKPAVLQNDEHGQK